MEELMTLADVPRNSLEHAEAYYRSHGKRISSEVYRILWGLQDDPEAFEAMSRRWRVFDERPHLL